MRQYMAADTAGGRLGPYLSAIFIYLSLQILYSSTLRWHIKDGCQSAQGMITQHRSPVTFPASSVILIAFPAESGRASSPQQLPNYWTKDVILFLRLK